MSLPTTTETAVETETKQDPLDILARTIAADISNEIADHLYYRLVKHFMTLKKDSVYRYECIGDQVKLPRKLLEIVQLPEPHSEGEPSIELPTWQNNSLQIDFLVISNREVDDKGVSTFWLNYMPCLFIDFWLPSNPSKIQRSKFMLSPFKIDTSDGFHKPEMLNQYRQSLSVVILQAINVLALTQYCPIKQSFAFHRKVHGSIEMVCGMYDLLVRELKQVVVNTRAAILEKHTQQMHQTSTNPQEKEDAEENTYTKTFLEPVSRNRLGLIQEEDVGEA